MAVATTMKIVEVITTQEASRRKVLEKTIAKGIGTVIKVGEALIEIKESRLYRDKFKNFAEYCDKKWGFTRMRAHQLIEAATVQKELPEDVKKFYTKTSQLNALAELPKEERAAAAKEIIESVKTKGGKITADVIKQHSPLRGVDTAKLDAPEPEAEWLEPEAPEAAPAVPLPNPVLPTKITETVEAKMPETMTPKQFEAALKVLETRAESAAAGNQKEREKYGVIVNALARRLLNPVKKGFNPYTS